MNNRFLDYRPPRIAMTLILLAAAMHVLVPLLPVQLFASKLVAISVGVSGFAVMMKAWWQFQQHKVAICPTDETDYLITDGVYRLTRNPMYLGMIMMLFAIAAFIGTLPFYVAAISYFAIINWVFCLYEEEKLERAFGQDYRAYRSQVRRWI